MNVELKRQLVHASGISLILILQIFGKWYSAFIFFMGLLFFLAWGSFRKANTNLGPITKIANYFMNQLKTYERSNEYFQGVVTFLLGAFLATVSFPIHIAATCIAVLAVGDSVSTLIGKMWGKHKLPVNQKKSWEGSTAFFISVFILLWFFDPIKALWVAFITTLVEMLPEIDDNLTIPLTVGILLTI